MITTTEAKELLVAETPVFFKDMEFVKITALIFRRVAGEFVANAELLDKNRNCIVIAPLEWIEKSPNPKIELPYQEDLWELSNKAKGLYADFLEEIGKEKGITAQDKLRLLIGSLLDFDTILTAEIRSTEKMK